MNPYYYKLEQNIERYTSPANTVYALVESQDTTLKLYPFNNVYEFDISDTFYLTDFSKQVTLSFKYFNDANNQIGSTINYIFIGYNAFLLDDQKKVDLINHRLMTSVPFWAGYPFSYILNGVEVNYTLNTAPIGHHIAEEKCNGIYIKFLNQYGYYSYYLFNRYYKKETKKSNAIKYNDWTNSIDPKIKVLRNEIETIYTIKELISNDELELIRQLSVSRDVYFLKGGEFISKECEVNFTEDIKNNSFEVEVTLKSLKQVYNG